MKILKVDGQKLCELRIKQGHTCRSLSEKAGVHYSIISRLEENATSPRPINAIRIAEALGVSFDDLFEIVDRNKKQEEGRGKCQ